MDNQMQFTSLSKSIVKTLLYYDIFNYPLKASEILRFVGERDVDPALLGRELCLLCDEGLIFKFGDFYTVQDNESNISRRIKGNVEAKRYLNVARQKAKMIMRFPFVRAVMVSGSLSKGFMDENSDIDFFIVTQPGRLWIARMLLVLYKRIFLFNSHRFFCVNYFVDTNHLEIEEKNIFTATELATVIPIFGADYYAKLHSANRWLWNFFPNYQPRPTGQVPLTQVKTLKRIMEKTIDLCFGATLDKFFMNLSLSRWKKMYQKKYPATDFQVAFKTKKYSSKNHPKNYQLKVTALYEQKWMEFQHRLPIDKGLQTTMVE